VKHANGLVPSFLAPALSFADSSSVKFIDTICGTNAPLPPAHLAARTLFHTAPAMFLKTLTGIFARKSGNEKSASILDADASRILGFAKTFLGGRPA